MLSTVDFNNEPSFETYKINNIVADWKLPSKREAIKAMGAQAIPNPLLGIRHVAAKHAGTKKPVTRERTMGQELPPSRRPSAVDLPRKGGGEIPELYDCTQV